MGGLIASLLAAPGQSQAPDAWQVHGQSTLITQGHGTFESPYQGPNSLRPERESATSFTATVMLGWQPWPGAEWFLDGEAAAGKGVSSVLGMAGAPNGETYRVGDPELKATFARVFLRQTWDLGGASETSATDAHQFAGVRTTRRFVLHFGKFSVMDVFDSNSYAHEPRTQFLNWSFMGHGAWDYPADTRGYTWGGAVEWYWDDWALRYGRFAEPLEANQMAMDHAFAEAHGDAGEVEHDHTLAGLPGAVRLLSYRNVARMGNYRESLALASAAPDITDTRASGRVKRGWGLNAEQSLSEDLGGFLRWSWNDGHTETWAFTEIDRSLSMGLSLKGTRWHHAEDRIGLALVRNGLSPDHRDYLAAGGLGFLLGDGRLSYAPECIAEAYYACSLGSSVTVTLDLQQVWNPAYNRDRGPLTLAALRLHAAF